MRPKINIKRDSTEVSKLRLEQLTTGECFRFVNWVDPEYFYMKTPGGYVALNSGEYFSTSSHDRTFRQVERIKVTIDVDMRRSIHE